MLITTAPAQLANKRINIPRQTRGCLRVCMTNAYEPQSEHEYELIGSITGTGDQVVVYYNHTPLRVGFR